LSVKNKIPDWMLAGATDRARAVWFLDIRGQNLNLDDLSVRNRINNRLREIIEEAAPENLEAPALIKTHIGEPNAWQRIIPDLARSTVEFLKSRGIDRIVVGDTTVLYSRGRGGKDNTPENIESYMNLARDHGWLELGVPFVVLDRSISSVPGVYEFSADSTDLATTPPNRFPVVRIGAGALVAGCIINHVHFTGHGLTGLALAVKGIAMGFADRRGKSQMHMAFGPVFDPEICDRCGICATECPEGALEYPGDDPPKLDEDKCVGCGQCLTDCPSGAITMKPRKIKQWMRGQDTINQRLADYFIGMVAGRWDSILHVAHMVKITVGCDCLNSHQELMSPDIGFLVGKNPFAVDRAAEILLEEVAGNQPEARRQIDMQRKADVYNYVENKYGLVTEPEIKKVK